METEGIRILWDYSQLWGVMALRAARSLGIPYRLVNGQKIAQTGLSGKAPLLAPGGKARQKALALGASGRKEIRAWIAGGGVYIGFCGGAGLALTHPEGEPGLDLCQWRRKSYQERIYHLISGHLRARVNSREMNLPVWWPGRFEPNPGENPEILAVYESPAQDLWIADLPLMNAPEAIRESWRKNGSLDPSLGFPQDQPLAIRGDFGKGQYILSYAHLETPDSPDANSWLCELLARCGVKADRNCVEPWNAEPAATIPNGEMRRSLHEAHTRLQNLLNLGKSLGFFFERTTWLMGWRQGAPGIVCNHLRAELSLLAELEPTPESLRIWTRVRDDLLPLLDAFFAQAEIFFWNFRLEKTIAGDGSVSGSEMERIFGHPMSGGGMAAEIAVFLERLIMASSPG